MTAVLGLDIGGTHTRARLVRDGAVLAEAQGASASLTAAGRTNADVALARVLEQIGVAERSLDAVCAGSAGSGSDDVVDFLAGRLGPLTRTGTVVVVNDVRLALAAAGVDEGVAVVAGTGSNCLGRFAGQERSAGGWGYLLGDEGSGYWIVRETVRELLRRDENGVDLADLGDGLLAATGCSSVRALLQQFYDDPAPDRWARFAVLVLDGADAFAADVRLRAAEALAGLAESCSRRLHAPPDLPVVLAGGLLTGYDKLTDQTRAALARRRPRAPVRVLTAPPVAGAVAIAMSVLGAR